MIIAEGMRFYHQHNEAAFFGWLDSMDVVSGYVGWGTRLNFSLSRLPTDDDLRNLLAIHLRYNINALAGSVRDRR